MALYLELLLAVVFQKILCFNTGNNFIALLSVKGVGFNACISRREGREREGRGEYDGRRYYLFTASRILQETTLFNNFSTIILKISSSGNEVYD